jgi:S1-C subfamily serine protease
MRLKTSTLIVVLSFLYVGTAEGNGNTYAEKVKAARQAVVEVLVAGQRQGTGFCVSSNGYVVTATHVVGSPEIVLGQPIVKYREQITVRLSDGKELSAVPVNNPSIEAPYHDSTLLKVEALTPHHLRIGDAANLAEGEEVYVVGFPFDVPVAVAYRGYVSAQFKIPAGTLSKKQVNNATIHVQIPIAKGFSGAALVRMSDDTAVGIITNKLGGISLKLETIRNSLAAGQKEGGGVFIKGVDPNETSLELINTLDAFLSAGAGWAVSIEYIRPLVSSQTK